MILSELPATRKPPPRTNKTTVDEDNITEYPKVNECKPLINSWQRLESNANRGKFKVRLNELPGLNEEQSICAPGLDFSLNLMGVGLQSINAQFYYA